MSRQALAHNIGYMQVHFRVYRNGDLYEEFALNAFDERFVVETDLLTCEHKVVEDPANANAKAVEALIKIPESDCTIALLIPVHESEDWEVVHPTDDFSVGFYCILGEPEKQPTG